MKSFSEREIFSEDVMAIWADAVDMVARVSQNWKNELRCHELARAAWKLLIQLNVRRLDETDALLHIVDGHLHSIEHSWLVYETAGPPLFQEYKTKRILDVYCPGRLPQVQLIDGDHFAVSRGYQKGLARTDIKLDVVEQLIREMSRGR